MRSNDSHLARARARLNDLHEVIDELEAQLRELRGQTVHAEEQLKAAVRVMVEAKTAETLEQLARKE